MVRQHLIDYICRNVYYQIIKYLLFHKHVASKKLRTMMIATPGPSGVTHQLGPGIYRMTGSSKSDLTGSFRLTTNLWKPSQRLAYEAQKFELEKVFGSLKLGNFTLPLNLNIELTGVLKPQQQKHVSVKFVLNSASTAVEERGVSPCRVALTLRKGYQLSKNPTVLPLTFATFGAIVTEMRNLFKVATDLIERETTFESMAEAGLPMHRIVKETITDKSTLIVVTLTAMNSNDESEHGDKEGILVMTIAEYYEDSANNCYQPGSRAVTMALNASYMLMYPVSSAIMTVHDSLKNIKIDLDKQETKLREQLLALEPAVDNWVDGGKEDLERYEAGIQMKEANEPLINFDDISESSDVEVDVEEFV
jgi:hypothetical protein